jgi:hypothetical protein
MDEPVSCFVPAAGTRTGGKNEMANPLNSKHNPRHIHIPDIYSNLSAAPFQQLVQELVV